MITLDNGVVVEEALTAKGYTPAAQVPDRVYDFDTIHHWGVLGQTHDGVVDFFANGPGQTSAHFVVSDGRVTCLVSPADVAWHAGTWDGNKRSIGIECRPEATDGDYATAASLIRYLRGSVHGDKPLVPHNYWYATECPGVWDLKRLDSLTRGTALATTGVDMAKLDADDQNFIIAQKNLILDQIWGTQTVTQTMLTQLAAAVNKIQPGSVNLDAIAKAVADEEAKRMAS